MVYCCLLVSVALCFSLRASLVGVAFAGAVCLLLLWLHVVVIICFCFLLLFMVLQDVIHGLITVVAVASCCHG